MSDLAISIAIQRRVVHALLLRELITRYGRRNIGFLWLFIEPALFTIGVSFIWSYTNVGGGHGGTVPVTTFALTGYSCLLLWRNIGSRCIDCIEPNLTLMFHRNVRIQDVILSRVLLEIFGVSVAFAVLSVSIWALELAPAPEDYLLLFCGWALLCWFGLILGYCIAALAALSELLDRFWHIIVYLLFPLSGAVFLTQWFPPHIAELLLWLPMVTATEIVRTGYFGSGFSTEASVLYLIGFNIVGTFFSMLLLVVVKRKLQI